MVIAYVSLSLWVQGPDSMFSWESDGWAREVFTIAGIRNRYTQKTKVVQLPLIYLS